MFIEISSTSNYVTLDLPIDDIKPLLEILKHDEAYENKEITLYTISPYKEELDFLESLKGEYTLSLKCRIKPL